MNDRDPVSLWTLHAQLLAATALVALVACGACIVAGAGDIRPGVVASIAAIGYAIYAVLASVFVAGLGPTATRKKVAMATLFALVLAPIATVAVLTMRPEKPNATPAAQSSPPQRAPPASASPRP
jgi:hypothetical protein